MAIFNQVVAGGGTTPTGTIQITTNGTHDVTNYATADVQVPTTAPTHYIEKAVDANGKLINGSSIIDLTGVTDVGDYVLNSAYRGVTFPANTSVDFSSLTTLSGQYACQNMFYTCAGVTSVDLSSLTTIGSAYACQYMFQGCTSLTSADLSSLTTVSSQSACGYMFSGCTSLTSADISSLETISGNGGCQYMFSGCTNLAAVNLSKLKNLNDQSVCHNMFNGCTSLTSVDLSGLEKVNKAQALASTFYRCSGLTSVNISSLVTAGGGSWPCPSTFSYCTSLTTITLDSLANMQNTNHAIEKMFQNCTSMANIYFPAITPNTFGTQTNQLENLVQNVTGCTIHFPKNLDPQGGSTVISSLTGYPNFGGTNTVIVFDLPSTAHLIGANTVEYERNPKYDTATALAWRVKDTGTLLNLVIDWTPYYTSGTTDPAVSDTIYSDSACTTAVTTISAIA